MDNRQRSSSKSTDRHGSGGFDYESALINIANDLLAAGQRNEALFQLQRLVTHFPNNANNHRLFGDGYLQSGLLPQARDAYAAALAISDNHIGASIGMAKYLWLSGKMEEAKQSLLEIQSHTPQSADAYFVTGQIEMVLGNLPASIAAFETAARISPRDVNCQRELGRAYYSAGETDEAEKVLRHAATLEPADAIVFNLLATIHRKKGQKEAGMTYMRRALDLDPKNTEIIENFKAMTKTKPVAESDRKLVVFVGNWPRTRHAKLSFALRSAGWQTVLLCKNTLGNDFKAYFDEVRYYDDDWQAVALAATYSPRAYHVFSIWSETGNAAIIENKPGKIVYECLDVVEGIKGGEDSIAIQKYCIEGADGLCCRDLRFQHLKRKLNYRLPEKRILFPDYCWNNDTEPPFQKQSLADGKDIHIVVCGSIDVEKLGQTEGVYLDFAKQFARQGIHLHIYPAHTHQLMGDSFEEIFSDYIELEQTTPFFHLHKTIPHEEVIHTLQQYDVGSLLNHSLVYDLPLKRYEFFQLNLSAGSRLFDYIDAGLPVLTHKSLGYQFHLMNRYGLALHTTPQLLSNLKDTLESFLSPDVKSRIKKAKDDYDVRRQIHRLTTFYESL